MAVSLYHEAVRDEKVDVLRSEVCTPDIKIAIFLIYITSKSDESIKPRY